MEPINTQLHNYLATLERKEKAKKRSIAFGLILSVILGGVITFSMLTSRDAKPALTQQKPTQSKPLPLRTKPEPVSPEPASESFAEEVADPVAQIDELGEANEEEPLFQDFGFRIEGDPVVGQPLTFKIVNFREDVTFVLYYGDGKIDEKAINLNTHIYKKSGTFAVRLKAYGPRTPENLYASYVLTVKEVGQSPFADAEGIGVLSR